MQRDDVETPYQRGRSLGRGELLWGKIAIVITPDNGISAKPSGYFVNS